MFVEEGGECFTSVRSGGDLAIIAAEPYFADGFVFGYAVVPGAKVLPSPDPADKLRLDPKGSHLDENRVGSDGHVAGSSESDAPCTCTDSASAA